ncbi:MAG: OmpH family outer membrane protein, partial [Gemmataceae bacterium]
QARTEPGHASWQRRPIVLRIVKGMMAVAVVAASFAPAMAQAPGASAAPGTAAAPAPSRGVAVFNVAKVMKEYTKWQFFAATMNKVRTSRAGELAAIRNQVLELEGKARVETVQANKTAIEQQLVGLQRTFEDKERTIRKEIDEQSAVHLKTLFNEIRTVVDAVAKTNSFDLVLAYPDALTQEEINSPLYFDLKMRPPAAMPFYVSPNIDITNVVVQTLNKNFPAPGPIDASTPGVTPTGGTTPPANPMK